MSLVHHTARAQVAALLAACTLASGCLGGGSGEPAQSAGPTFGTPVRLVDCSDWRTATPSQRSGIVEGVKAVSGGPTGSPAGTGAVLSDERAYELFEGYCKAGFAKRFKLYKLYTRAAAFGGG